MHRIALIVSIAALSIAAPLEAQQLGPSGGIPAGHKPPPGMCRIWIDGVPPGRQPAPTDCPTAVRNRPSNGRVIWGDDDRKRESDRPTRPTAEGEREERRGNTRKPDETEEERRPTSRRPDEAEERRPTSRKPDEAEERRPTSRRPDDAEERRGQTSKPDEVETRKRGSDRPGGRKKPDLQRKPD